jgi:pyruvate dehydrogenase E2 component (dihydrolipoamide acetyltransferase)
MATKLILPALGMSQETGKILHWFKAEGDQVQQGEEVVEIETDKTTLPLEAPASGYLSEISAEVGADIPVGQVIALILTRAEVESRKLPGAGVPPVSSGAASGESLPAAAEPAGPGNLPKTSNGAANPAPRQDEHVSITIEPRLIAASPKARRLASERGLILTGLKGSGPLGAILFADVPAPAAAAAATATLPAPAQAAAALPEPVPAPALTGEKLSETISISNTWRIMADRLSQSWTTVPHFYLFREVNVSQLMAWKEKAQKRTSEKLTYTDLLVTVVAAALRKHPRLNAAWLNNSIQGNKDINIGLAVAINDGLVVPVIQGADTKRLSELAAERKSLVEKAQAGRLRPDNLSGGTFTISNLGMYGVDAFQAIINPPQAAILAVGRIKEKVVALAGQTRIQPIMTLSLSCDHRVVDGARGAQFLEELADLIEEPLGVLV